MDRPRTRPTALLCAVGLLAAATLTASSHREAPGILLSPQVDATDFYMFRSYEPGREGFVTLVANYVPLQDPYGGPNYFPLDPDARYRINVDNSGDGRPDLIFEFKAQKELRDIALDVAGERVSIPLKNAGPITAGNEEALNVVESYTLRLMRPGGSGGPVRDAATGDSRFRKPMDNIGRKSFPDYAAYAARFVYDVELPGCADGRLFVGQRRDSFTISLGEVFDLVNIRNPIGGSNREGDDLADKNVTSFIVEVPIDCLTAGRTDVVGAWTTADVRRTRTALQAPSYARPQGTGGGFVQVSRLGMPLVNEVVIGLKDKNRFNASRPHQDGRFATYVTNPTLPELIEILFGEAGVVAPDNFPRRDLLATFVTGIAGLNEFGFGEMQRLNVTIAPTPKAQQQRLGVIAGDNAGYPNGRRPGDDIVDISLRVAMGLLCHAFPGVFCEPADAPSGTLPFTDGARQSAQQFGNAFPYLRTPISGSDD